MDTKRDTISAGQQLFSQAPHKGDMIHLESQTLFQTLTLNASLVLALPMPKKHSKKPRLDYRKKEYRK
jgi:hypothetical protein